MKYIFNSIFSIIITVLFSSAVIAQNGVINGKVFDKATGESIIGAIIEIKKDGNLLTGLITDIEGSYHIQVNEGTYEMEISYLSYARHKVEDVLVKSGEVSTVDLLLTAESVSLSEIVVKAEAIRSTEVALISLQRQSSSIIDGVSSQQINRTGGSNAADAIRQMPAAVIQDGKFIVVRGLGDRYSVSQLNGITLPSTDPYRNSASLDLIPTQIIDNIVTVKTFTPDIPGNFSGGLVNINTKSIPDKFYLSMGVSTGYNSQSSLIKNFQKHQVPGKMDWLGFDDGSRNQPGLLLNPEVRNELSTSTYLNARQPGNDEIRDIFHQSSRALSNSFLPEYDNTPLNMGMNVAVGHRFPLFNRDFGFNFSVNYANNYRHYDDGIVATYINTNTDFLFPYQRLTESKSVQNPSLGSLFNMVYKLSDRHILSGNIIFNNEADIISRTQTGDFIGQVSNSMAEFNTHSVEFIQRQITNYQLSGKHIFPSLRNIQLEWNGSITNSFQNEPDLRYFAYTRVCEENEGEGCEYYINNSEVAFPYHFFRRLNDSGYEGKLDISIPLTKSNTNANALKLGGFYSVMERDFEEYRYQLNNGGIPGALNFTNFNGDFDSFLDIDNFGIIDTTYASDGSVQRYVTGYHYVNQINARNFYSGSSNISAAYAMVNYQLTRSLKAIGGLRMETTDMEVVSLDTSVQKGNIDQLDFLYSLNLVYALNEKSNIRVAATQTLARPNLRELAPFVQFDTKNGFFNVGNPNLQRTLIQNYDIRYEVYPDHGELFALSAFYKIFDNPIIRAFNPRATIPELSFINVDKAIVMGAELEFRKELDFISPWLKNLYFNSNLALIYSDYNIPADEIENSKNIDPEYSQTRRPFQGQAPYVVNGILSYINDAAGLELALSYNVSGQKLYNISLFATPDVYEQPFSLLNFKASKRMGKNYQISLAFGNILNARDLKVYTFHDEDYVAESNSIGRTFNFNLSYRIR